MKYESVEKHSNFILQRAVDKLQHYGMDVFEMFANEVDMSFCDRNRCISKCKISFGRSDLLEMACPDELKRERWDHYTRTMKYSTNKARKLLDLIDKSYENQFIPRVDPGKLAGGMLQGVG